ncbi:MAG: hypothetical protein H6558_22820, partial [Lewinellaceae bacterium]|nr:hypothetical protein [Lewinellaceae bacterium]
MAIYKTPGVYVEEISTLPPSVAEVATAIPAFIGYTQKVPTVTDTFRVNTTGQTSLEFTLSGQPLPGAFTANLFQARNKKAEAITVSAYDDSSRKITIDVRGLEIGEAFTVTYPVLRPTRIGSMLEYKTHFGGAYPSAFDIPIHHYQQSGVMSLGEPARKGKDFLLYYCMSHYFSNGGGPCYIISVGNYGQSLDKAAFEAGLTALSKEDEPTLILLADAVNLGATDYYAVCQQALKQCADLKDRFAILDVRPEDTDASGFRDGIGMNNLKYGAAYTPYLSTVIPYAYDPLEVNLNEIVVQDRVSIKIGPGGGVME